MDITDFDHVPSASLASFAVNALHPRRSQKAQRKDKIGNEHLSVSSRFGSVISVSIHLVSAGRTSIDRDVYELIDYRVQ